MIHRLLTLAATVLLLAACQSGLLARFEDTLFTRLTGGQFTLHHDVIIPAGRVRVIYQDGKAAYGASELEPRCELEVQRILETPQTIPAGNYRIGQVRGYTRYVDRPPGGTLLADGGGVRFADDGGDNAWLMYTYRMPLVPEQPGDAPVLTCGGAFNYAFYASYPSLQEMQAALGEQATLTPR